jgi:hypothetical protein
MDLRNIETTPTARLKKENKRGQHMHPCLFQR